MIRIEHPEDCCGCTACASICPHNAISMKPDTLGFLYPEVDTEKCVDCGLCEKVCAFNDDYDTSLNLPQPDVYAARHKSMKEIEASQSGAAFVALSDWILEQGGVVYGAGYTDRFRVVHKRATTKKERDEFRGSKYVQSDLNIVFRQVKDDLKRGLLVLFSGTPCQTAALASYIGRRLRDNLYLMDIVCHGVPGPFVWRDYLQYLEGKEKLPLTAVNFRDKSKSGWRSHVESFCFAGTYTYTYTYTYLFYTHINLRYSCGVCHYTNLKRSSDITVGDCWGVEKTKAIRLGMDNKGCSLFLINTPKGKKWFDSIKDSLDYMPVNISECLQPNLIHPSRLHPKRRQYEEDYRKNGFVYVMKKYGNQGWRYKIRQLGRSICSSFLKNIIKNSIL